MPNSCRPGCIWTPTQLPSWWQRARRRPSPAASCSPAPHPPTSLAAPSCLEPTPHRRRRLWTPPAPPVSSAAPPSAPVLLAQHAERIMHPQGCFHGQASIPCLHGALTLCPSPPAPLGCRPEPVVRLQPGHPAVRAVRCQHLPQLRRHHHHHLQALPLWHLLHRR